MRRALLAIAILLSLLTVAAPRSLAQIRRPSGSGRLIHEWQFEDRERFLEPVPRHWFRSLHDPEAGVDRPGFPRFNLASLDDSRSVSGAWSLQLPTQGGSTSLKLARGVAPVMPEADVLLTTWIQTEDLVHAKARIIGQLLDDHLEPIPEGRFTSEAIRSDRRWTFVRVDLKGHADAAWLQIELLLLQPEQLAESPPGIGAFFPEDVDGAAWFDDIRLYQSPRVRFDTQTEDGVTVAPDRPRLELTVHDLAGQPLSARIVVYGWDGSLIDELRNPVSSAGLPLEWAPELPAFGWYRAAARILSEEGAVTQIWRDFVWLAPSADGPTTAPTFGIAIADSRAERLELIPELVRRLGVGSVTLDVWRRNERATASGAIESPEADVSGPLEHILEALLERGVELTFVLELVPERLAHALQVDPEDVLEFLAGDDKAWFQELRPLLSRFGERVRRWQIGPFDGLHAATEPDLMRSVETIHDTLFRVIPRPVVVLPWPVHAQLPGDVPPSVALAAFAPAGVPSDALPHHVRALGMDHITTVSLQPLDHDRFGIRADVRETAKRAISAWIGGAERISIPAPWSWRLTREGGAAPTPNYSAWRTLVGTLTGLSALGELPMTSGLRAVLVGVPDSSAIGSIIAWNETAPAADAHIRGYLGEGPIVIRDLFGNEHASNPTAKGVHHIPLNDLPVIIEGVDLDLLRFRSALRLDPPFIETRAQEHDVELVIENPWSTAMGGRLRIASPEDWQISPRIVRMAVPARGTQRIPISITFGLNELAGMRTMLAEVELSAERRYPTIQIPIPVELGLRHLEVAPSYRFVDGAAGEGADLILTIMVTNIGAESTSFDAQIIAPEYAGREASVHALSPGETTLRRFRFENAADILPGRNVHLAIRERDGTGRFNRVIPIR